jgi:hypothetical protein
VLHSRYMVKNDVIIHYEDPANPWYTKEGHNAARHSNLAVSSSATWPDRDILSVWMTGPFHGVAMIDPSLLSTGYGSYREAIGDLRTGGCLDILRGTGTIPSQVRFPIYWPKPGGIMPVTSYLGNELPDPLSPCSGYRAPTGAPVYLQIGPGNLTPKVTAHSLSHNGVPLEHCVYHETTYTNPDISQQNLGRDVLGHRDAIILLPRNPLIVGHTYMVSITANGTVHTWNFTVSNFALMQQIEAPDYTDVGFPPYDPNPGN